MQKSFGQMELEDRLDKNGLLYKVDALVNWNEIKIQLSGLYKRDQQNLGGQHPYDSISMFKAILLGQWHSLSDPQLEQALRVRLDFIAFCGFGLSELPDETTLCRFRNRLIERGRMKGLLESINIQLQRSNLMLKKSHGAIVDATLISSAARPKQEVVIDDSTPKFEDGSQALEVQTSSGADVQASWVKKGKRSHYGYRGYAVTNEEGYLLGAHAAPANESEMNHFAPALERAGIDAGNTERVYADKGSSSRAHRQWLKEYKLKSGVMHKATRGKALRERQKRSNKLISRVRFRVEQFFGTLKRKFKLARASYFGTVKVEAQMLFKGICANLLKAANKICLLQSFDRIGTPKIG